MSLFRSQVQTSLLYGTRNVTQIRPCFERFQHLQLTLPRTVPGFDYNNLTPWGWRGDRQSGMYTARLYAMQPFNLQTRLLVWCKSRLLSVVGRRAS